MVNRIMETQSIFYDSLSPANIARVTRYSGQMYKAEFPKNKAYFKSFRMVSS